ncbi:MAG: tRNA (adenosine(37)-N6)-threonylcarbamoyltransferase complex dimerization subunit type 1 TsaB [Gemmatimonadota bacterium]
MLTIALDTSTPIGSIALGRCSARAVEEDIQRQLPTQAVRSESVLPEIDRLLQAAGMRPSQISRIVVGSGPGSFTGVRISAALAKGMRAALRAELHAWSSLAAIAVASGGDGRVCAAIDARRGQVYAAGYEIEREGTELVRLRSFFGPVAERFEMTLGRLRPIGAWTLSGDLPEPLDRAAERADIRRMPPSSGESAASALLRLAGSFPASGRIMNPEAWEPDYVRASSAEREAER